jgi:hypothetical protein
MQGAYPEALSSRPSRTPSGEISVARFEEDAFGDDKRYNTNRNHRGIGGQPPFKWLTNLPGFDI